MHHWPEKLKKDILNVRNKVKDSRTNLTGGVIEKKAKEAGKSVAEFSQETYKALDHSLEKLTVELSGGAYKVSDKVQHETGELTETIKKIHTDVRSKRREITGGYLEDNTKEALESIDKRLEKWLNKMKE
jgi:hypothetical protein